MEIKKETYIVDTIVQESSDVVTLCFVPESGEKLRFETGQFVRVELVENPQKLSGKPYSISSCANDPFVSITVKKTGQFSSALHSLHTGDKVVLFGPMGNFTVRDSMKKLVFLAGGIGVAPFFSMIKNIVEKGDVQKELYLFYSNKTKDSIAFYEKFKEMEQAFPNLHVIFLLTQEPGPIDGIHKYGRMNTEILKSYVQQPHDFDYFVCGSVPFVTDMSKMVEQAGVDEDRIFAELFY
jgi:nitric oxide dioxygenase